MRTISATFLAASLTLGGCTGTSPTDTMTLLKAGDAKVCVAQDIEDSLRRLILPEGDADAAKAYTVSFDNTTMEQFDKGVTKASCNSYVEVDGPDGIVIERTPVDYAVSPAAQNAATFIVTAPTTPLRERLVQDHDERNANQAIREDQEATAQRLTALVKPGWLIGRWVSADAGSDACGTGPYLNFARKGLFDDTGGSGRWSLTGMDLTITTSAVTARFTVDAADIGSFTWSDANSTSSNYRRCTGQEMRDVAAAQAAEPDADEPELQADALPDLNPQ